MAMHIQNPDIRGKIIQLISSIIGAGMNGDASPDIRGKIRQLISSIIGAGMNGDAYQDI